jgi:hypothetical protein
MCDLLNSANAEIISVRSSQRVLHDLYGSRLFRCRMSRLPLSQSSLLELTDGGGEEPNHTTARKPGPLEIIQYSLVQD